MALVEHCIITLEEIHRKYMHSIYWVFKGPKGHIITNGIVYFCLSNTCLTTCLGYLLGPCIFILIETNLYLGICDVQFNYNYTWKVEKLKIQFYFLKKMLYIYAVKQHFNFQCIFQNMYFIKDVNLNNLSYFYNLFSIYC